MTKPIKSFSEFWPFYMSQHKNKTSRGLHIIGTTLAMGTVVLAMSLDLRLLVVAPLFGYSFAWIGHFFFEKNKPATFTYPFWSLLGDFKMTFNFYKSLLRM